MKIACLSRACVLFALLLAPLFLGCKTRQASDPGDSPASDLATDQQTLAQPKENEDADVAPDSYVLNAESLLAAALPAELLEQGWVRLFDGQSLVGWFSVGEANWQAKDGVIKVTRGERSYLCTNVMLVDYELQLEFRSDPTTNSGVFLRTSPQPEDVSLDCLELNIAPPDNPFPTGSFVQRKKVEPAELGDFDPTLWHKFRVRLVGEQVEVFLDDKQVAEIQDKTSVHRGHISLQHNEGRVEFRNIMLRPIHNEALKTGNDWQDDWTKSEKEEGTFSVESTEDGLKLVGGLGQLQSKRDFGDFFLQAKYTLARPEVNSGIFFRCVKDAMLDGYECQLNHATIDDDPLRPADAGAGAIFRRQPARIVVGDGTQPTHISLFASGQQMVTWVNGLQVAEFVDSRPPHDNPREGSRTAPGPIAIQGHDPTTEIVIHELAVSEAR
ncbi:MAG: DUF1080 domain-containing protein [Pirellulaceae bacterium]